MNRARWISVSLLAAALAAPAKGFAQDSKAAAEALFDEAKKLMEQKRFGDACPKFADSQRMDPGVGTLLNLGLCYKQNGQTASAWSTYREAASQARSEGQNDREALARQEAAALESHLSKLVIEVPPATAAIAGLEIRRDGTLVPQGLWGMPAPVDPGVRAIDVTAPNRKPRHLDAQTIGPGATAKVVIPELEAGPPPPPTPPGAAGATTGPTPGTPPDQGVSSDEHPGRTQRIIGFVVAGAGAITGGVGTWFSLLSIAQHRAADSASSQARKDKFNTDADGSRTIGFIGIGVGAAALIGGIVIVVAAPSGPATATELTLVPAVAESGGGFALRGRF